MNKNVLLLYRKAIFVQCQSIVNNSNHSYINAIRYAQAILSSLPIFRASVPVE